MGSPVAGFHLRSLAIPCNCDNSSWDASPNSTLHGLRSLTMLIPHYQAMPFLTNTRQSRNVIHKYGTQQPGHLCPYHTFYHILGLFSYLGAS